MAFRLSRTASKITEHVYYELGLIAVNVMACALGDGVAAVPRQPHELCLQFTPFGIPLATLSSSTTTRSAVGVLFAGGKDGERQIIKVYHANAGLTTALVKVSQFGHIGSTLSR